MPTSPKVKRKILEILPHSHTGTIFELGSGWGTVAFSLAKKYPLSLVIGYETSLVPYYYSEIKRKLLGPSNLRFKRQDLFEAPCQTATLIVLYLYPNAMTQLAKKFRNELCDNTRIVSHTFALNDYQPNHIVTVDDLYNTKIYVYITGIKVPEL